MTLVGSYEGSATRDRIRETYEAMVGATLPGLAVFEVIACVKRLASVTISISAGAEQLGMRPGAAAMMTQQLLAFSAIYDRLRELSGVRIPEVEALLAMGSD
jgi:hypothetical protein